MAKESSLWSYLSKRLPAGHWDRIESIETSPGFPDIRYQLYQGPSGTIELKSGRAPFRKGGLRKSQMLWIAEELTNGGTVWIVAQVHRRIFWLEGRYYSIFNQMTENEIANEASLLLIKGQQRSKESIAGEIASLLRE